ncbi:hypothetical protein [Phaffia rhodozyma]|uniref:Uncharacterized protein n=1 Tax=Phaffia rhodozyma TaxID=264483 RepID=A0A0F7SN45_PHARH|nr:hypothetical protein [Phaffia rhodozyma]
MEKVICSGYKDQSGHRKPGTATGTGTIPQARRTQRVLRMGIIGGDEGTEWTNADRNRPFVSLKFPVRDEAGPDENRRPDCAKFFHCPRAWLRPWCLLFFFPSPLFFFPPIPSSLKTVRVKFRDRTAYRAYAHLLVLLSLHSSSVSRHTL